MKIEREAKLPVADPAAARAAVVSIGARLVRARHFEDNLLLDDAATSLRGRGAALRLRRTDGRSVLTFKGRAQPDAAGLKVRPEVEVDVSDADAARSLLDALGYAPVFRYQKYREVWEWQGVEIVLDETPIGAFLEIEGERAAIDEAARTLGRTPGEYVSASYPDLFRAQGGRGDMVF